MDAVECVQMNAGSYVGWAGAAAISTCIGREAVKTANHFTRTNEGNSVELYMANCTVMGNVGKSIETFSYYLK